MKATMLRKTTITVLAAGLLQGFPMFAVDESSAAPPAPLFNDLGNHHHPITTKAKRAQRYFDQGLILLYGFNHNEAIRSFEAAAKVDPDCAMAWWGVACAYGPNINMPMLEPAVPKAWQALQKAIALRGKASPKEQAYIDALAKRYVENPPKDRAPLDQAYAEAMREVAKQYPDDLDAQTLYAEALMDTSPWNYWQPDLTPKPNAKEAIAVVESVLARVRQHPGADHLYIHRMEAGPHPAKAERSADRLGKFAPGAGHLVHMPSHTYVRVGRYHDASTANEKASLADESYLAQCLQQGMYPGGYYPHNVHFLWFACDLEGRSEDAIKAAKALGLHNRAALWRDRRTATALSAFARLRAVWPLGRNPERASAGADFPFDRAMWHYARGLALAAKGKADAAAQEYAACSNSRRPRRSAPWTTLIFPARRFSPSGTSSGREDRGRARGERRCCNACARPLNCKTRCLTWNRRIGISRLARPWGPPC
jgi:tetratricopeptide (TPR) repeat protein